ncbi:MAG: glycosyltransferase family 4 protein [Pseudomonadales bacterium]
MKIGVDARPLTVPTFGIGRYALELLQRMVHLNPSHEWFFYADRPLSRQWSDIVTIRDFPNHNRLMSLGRTQLAYSRWGVIDDLDVFWSPRHHLPLLMDVPQVVSIHDVVWRKYPETMQRANYLVEKFLMPSSARRARSIITISQASKQDIHKELGVELDKITVIYPSADPGDFEVTAEEYPRQSYFFFLGTNDPRKNLRRMLAAHKEYLTKGGEQKLLIAGSIGWGGELDLHDGAEALGYVEDGRLKNLIYHSTALVLPSLYEGFGLPLVEAIKLGVPVIASRVSALPEAVGSAGILVEPTSIDEICAAFERLAKEDERLVFAERCPEQARKFDWDKAAVETLSVIESAV